MAGASNNGDHSHKGMGGNYISPGEWQDMLERDGLFFDGDAQTQGGLLWVTGTHEATGWVKPPQFRQEPTELRSKDINQVITEDRPDGLAATPFDLQQGTELELYGYNPARRDLAYIMSDEAQERLAHIVPVRNREMFDDDAGRWSCSVELTQAQIEMNVPEGRNRAANALALVNRLKLLDRVVDYAVKGAMILPVSALPHRELSETDVTSDPYVRRMAFEVMGWNMSKNFSGSSVQNHTEGLSRTAILAAANQYQHVSPLFYGLTLAAPFTHGEPSGLSGRYKTRVEGSPSAGIYEEPLPVDMPGYWSLVEAQLKAGATPSAARGAGQHRDRTRFDIKPYGTIESSEGDTAGASPRRLVAVQYAKDVLLWRLQRQHLLGDGSHYERYPRLFREPSRYSYELADDASYKIGMHGLAATVFGQDDREYTGEELFEELLGFLDEPVKDDDGRQLYSGLPEAVREELMNAAWTPDEDMFAILGRDRIPSLRTYYEKGFGTAAHWQKARYDALRKSGVGHEAALHETLRDIAESWRSHIRTISPKAVAKIVQSTVKVHA